MAIEWDRLARGKLWCVLGLLAALASSALMVAEAADADLGAPSIGEVEDSETPVDIPDAVLRRTLEVALGKGPGDPITRGEMATLLTLFARDVRQLTGIEYAINLRELSLPSGAISDLVPLAGLTSLTYLDLADNEFVDVSPLAGLTSLTTLYLRGSATSQDYVGWTLTTPISDVTPLAGLTSLISLDLSYNEVRDLSPLSGLRSLTSLNLFHNPVADISPLAGLTSLTQLNLSGSYTRESPTDPLIPVNPISNVTPLAGLTSLTTLDLSYNAIQDVSPLAGLTSLNSLYLSYNEIQDLSPLTGLGLLRRLGLWTNRVTDLSPLSDMKSLRYLDLAHVDGDYTLSLDLSPLASLVDLEELILRANGVSDLSPLAGLTSLRRLHLDSNEISDLRALEDLTSLTYLDLYHNLELFDLSPLSGLASLRTLRVGYCGTQLRDIGPLIGLSLDTLRLPGNGIVDASPFAQLTSLKELSLTGNYITNVSSLSGLESLSYLGLKDNAIADLSPLLHNPGLGDGDVLNVIGNPLNRESVEAVIPQLVKRGVEVVFKMPVPQGWEVMEIADAGFRAALERRLSKGEGVWIAKEEMTRLRGLAASQLAIRDLAGIEVASRLLRLDLSDNAISDLAPLADLAELQYLFLEGNDINNVEHLASLPLLALTLSDNTVEDVAPLTALYQLYSLALDGNSIRDLPALPRSLRQLQLTNNKLSDIEALANMRLNELRLSGNAVTSLAPLAGQPLRYLHLNGNQVADLTPLNFASLVELHAKKNVLRDISPLLDGEALLAVDVRGNPLSQDAVGVLETLRERETTVLAGERVPYFPAAGRDRAGFVRVINRSETAGDVFIEATDDAGVRAGPVRWRVGAGQAVHFNSTDLEGGNAAKGLTAGIGRSTSGDWRLELISPLDIEVLSYVRTDDGFVTAMHDVAADATLPFFNPGSNDRQRSILRTVNTEAEPAKWVTGGYDDAGKWHRMAGSIEVLPGQALTLRAAALEGAHGLGDGAGKWRLRVRGFPWFAMSLLESPTGHLTNLSTAPVNATRVADGRYRHRLPLFPAAGGERTGFARVINRSQSSGEVAIEAVDDDGNRFGPVQLALGAGQTIHFNSDDLEGGNAAKGISSGVGAGSGDWHLELTSTLDLQVLSYIRTADGFLTSMHDVALRTDDGDLWIPFFNPGANRNQISHLHLVNWGDMPADATITGVDDAGRSPGEAVRVMIGAGVARKFTAAELETGNADGLSGVLGDGKGKWRLHVATSEEVEAMSLLSLPTGHITNLSTTSRRSE